MNMLLSTPDKHLMLSLWVIGSYLIGGFILVFARMATNILDERPTYTIYDIEKDGLFNKNDVDLSGRVAFIVGNAIISGYYLNNGDWVANTDLGLTTRFPPSIVKKYVIFDKPIYTL